MNAPLDGFMSQIFEAMAGHAERYSAHLDKKKSDLQMAIKVLTDLGQKVPKELVDALTQVDEDIECNDKVTKLTDGVLTGKIKVPKMEDFSPELKSGPEDKAQKTMSEQTYGDDSYNGQLTRDLNAEVANRPHFKVFVPQVFGWDEYKPFDEFKALISQEDGTETSPPKLLGITRKVMFDAMPKLKVAKEWAEKVAVDSPTAHREWLSTDSACGSKESKAKLNLLLRELFELENSVTFYLARAFPTPEKRLRAIQGGLRAALFLPDDVRQSVQRIVMTKLCHQLKNLYGIYENNRLRMWGSPFPYKGPEDDSGDDESSAEEEDLDKPPVMSFVFTPFGTKFLQGGPKRK